MNTRTAIIRNENCTLEQIQRYLPGNYTAEMDGDVIVISGEDNAGWTLDGYVIPRLFSGLIAAVEVELEDDTDKPRRSGRAYYAGGAMVAVTDKDTGRMKRLI